MHPVRQLPGPASMCFFSALKRRRARYFSGKSSLSAEKTHLYPCMGRVLRPDKGGFFRTADGRRVDRLSSGGGHVRASWRPAEAWRMDLSVNYEYTDQGANPYYYEGPATPGEAEEYPAVVPVIPVADSVREVVETAGPDG